MFEVPARATSTVEPVPIKAMGRFVHEACPVDPKSGIVYMTEDNGDPGDGFYRYLPNHRGKLHRGGKLQMLKIKGKPGFSTVPESKHGKTWECEWVDIDDPDPNGADDFPQAVYMQGRHKGGAKFSGLEGGTFAKGSCYFTASDGGPSGQGQVWRYTPDNRNFKRGELELVLASPRGRVLNNPDGIAVSPRGGIVLCEDGESEDIDGRRSFMRGITPDGELFDFLEVTRRCRSMTTSATASTRGWTSAAGTGRRARGRSARARPPAPASARTASGSSSTCSTPGRRSRSPGRGTRAGSRPGAGWSARLHE